MVDSTRALLDELMGKDRNLLPNEKPKKNLHYTDPEVCKYFLCGFCPNELFTNTKSDLGPCPKVHDVSCRDEFSHAPERERQSYEDEFILYLERLVSDLDKRIKRGHERLDHQNDMPNLPISDENREKVDALHEKILTLLKEIEDLAEEGQIEESQNKMKQLEQLKQEKEQLIKSGEFRSITQQEKRMKVCDICGAFLVIGDTDKRTASHLEGKQHQGYLKIRTALEEFSKKREDRKTNKRGDRDDRKDKRDNRDRDRRKGTRNGSSENHFRERDRERDRERERDRDRERSRDRDRDRSRPRIDDRYDRSRDKRKDRDSYDDRSPKKFHGDNNHN